MADKYRFAFGKNWRAFLKGLTTVQIQEAKKSLQEALESRHLNGFRFLDAGSGSGLFSLAARRLGANVHSFDFDKECVACTSELKCRYDRGNRRWHVERGSVLDKNYMLSLGEFDVIYSWGVLHHTGDMWKALDHIQIPAKPGALLYIAIYNDQGVISRIWRRIKRIYVSSPAGRSLILTVFLPHFFFRAVIAGMVKYRSPLRYFRDYRQKRGMSIWHDWIDWLGGYPFQVARPEEIMDFFQSKGFVLTQLTRTRRMGGNEFVFKKMAASRAAR